MIAEPCSCMRERYQNYIASLELNEKTAYGKCEVEAKRMKKAFPELTLTKGWYYCGCWGKREHWWLYDDFSERIIDPTAIQFPSYGMGEYEELTDEHLTPTGKCPNCGEYCYNHEYIHEACEDSFAASM